MWYQPSKERPACLGLVDAKQHVRSDVGRRPRPENGRLNLMQLQHGRGRRKTDWFLYGRHHRILLDAWVLG
jgi:hypothetical protein